MVGRDPGTVGLDAESRARQYLVERGLRPITRNFRCRVGEIDLVMLDAGCLVFVEVRYRRNCRFVDPGMTVDIHKQRKLIRTAALYIAHRPKYATSTVRFDVVAVEGDTMRWIRDAFRPADSSL